MPFIVEAFKNNSHFHNLFLENRPTSFFAEGGCMSRKAFQLSATSRISTKHQHILFFLEDFGSFEVPTLLALR